MHEVGHFTSAQEDYLEIILDLLSTRRVARVKDIAAKKGVKMASVTEALKRLSAEGLVAYEAREYVELTPAGEALARKVASRHEFLRRFLVDVLMLDPAKAEADACAIEHHLSVEALEHMAMFYQHVSGCPQVDASFLEGFRRCLHKSEERGVCDVCHHQSSPHGQSEEPLHALDQLGEGVRAVVRRVRAAPAIRQRLVEMGVLPGAEIEVEGVAPLGDPIRVRVRGYRLSLRKAEAAAILVTA